MTLPGLYLDEDAQSAALVAALRARGISVTTTSEEGMCKSTDREQLYFASSRNLVLVTFNVADFVRLHNETLGQGEGHSGIIVVRQQRWGPGELARQIIRKLVAASDRGMRDRCLFVL